MTDVETGPENKFAEREVVVLGLNWIETAGETDDDPVSTDEELGAPKVKFAPMVLFAGTGVIVRELLTSLNRFPLESGKFNSNEDVVAGLETAEFTVEEAVGPKAVEELVDFTLNVLWTPEIVVTIGSLHSFSPN